MKLIRLASFVMITAFVTGQLFAQGSHSCGSKERTRVNANEGHDMTHGDTSRGDVTDEREEVLVDQERIMSDMRALDTQLQRLISKMNAVEGSEKTDAMADVVNELVWQRTEIHEDIIAIQADIMRYMENHTGAEMSHSTHSVQDCPMMQNMTEHTESESTPEKEGAHQH